MPLDVFEASSSVQCDKRGPRSAFFIICPHKKTSRWEIGDTEQTYGINSSFNSDEKSSSCFFFFLSSLCLFYSPIFTLFIILSFCIFLSALSLGGSGFLFPLHQTQGQEVCPWWRQEVKLRLVSPSQVSAAHNTLSWTLWDALFSHSSESLRPL